MNQKEIEKILGIEFKEEIKPNMILDFYKNEDSYSEGEIEDRLIDLIAQYPPDDYSVCIRENFSWSSYYHLSHFRKNLLNWYPFKEESNVLEIGCGLGALTGLLCDKCSKVTAVELSKKRATAALLRCRERENLEIIVGNLNDIRFEEKFDYITLIGVLEYQGTYTDSENPYRDFLEKIKALLKPEGKLIVAIENKYGLKYWCGAAEDHTGVPFDGINQYEIGSKNARTFAKQELDVLLEESGYGKRYFYYPLPDYKLPTIVYSQNYLPKVGSMQDMRPYDTAGFATMVADECNIYKDLIQNNVFEFFANSFLVECTVDSAELGETIFAALSTQRAKEYRIRTTISMNQQVTKAVLHRESAAKLHITQTYNNGVELESRGLQILPADCMGDRITMQFVSHPTLEEVLKNAAQRKDKQEMWNWLDQLRSQIMLSSEEGTPVENMIIEMGIDTIENANKYGTILKKGYLDMIPRNCFVDANKMLWFDQEWVLENIPATYVLQRSIAMLYDSNEEFEQVIGIQEIWEKYKLKDNLEAFRVLSAIFNETVLDVEHFQCTQALLATDGEKTNIVNNIRKVMR